MNPSPKRRPKSKVSSPASPKTGDRNDIIACLDRVTGNWHTLRTLTALLELCEEAPTTDIEPEVIGNAAHLMSEELDRMRTSLKQLEKQVTS